MRKLGILLPVAGVAVLMAGCSLAPKYERPDEKLPAAMGEGASTAPELSLDKWWERFNDPTLNKLVEQALARNTDLMQAYGNVSQARAALGETDRFRVAVLASLQVAGDLMETRQELEAAREELESLRGKISSLAERLPEV